MRTMVRSNLIWSVVVFWDQLKYPKVGLGLVLEEKMEEVKDVPDDNDRSAIEEENQTEPEPQTVPQTSTIEESSAIIDVPTNSEKSQALNGGGRPGAVAVGGGRSDENHRASEEQRGETTNRYDDDKISQTDLAEGNFETPSDARNRGNLESATVTDPTLHLQHRTLEREMDGDQEPTQTASRNPSVLSEEADNIDPMVHAELVSPPVEAYHVSIDEEPSQDATFSPFEIEQHRDDNKCTLWFRISKGKRVLIIGILAVLVLTAIACVISIPLLLKSHRNEDSTSSPIENLATPTQAPTYAYPCFTSTFDILQSQRFEEPIPQVYVICPNTLIKVGTFRDLAVSDFRFVDGDYPISVIRENVVIQCGIDGRRENNCTLDGGFIQVLLMQRVPSPEGGFDIDGSVDNMVIRGLTFTGTPINAGPFSGNSVTISHPGQNMRFEDCLWTNFSAQNGLIGVYRNHFQVLTNLSLSDQSTHVTFSDCIFDNIIYDSPLIHAERQTVVIQRSIFQGIKLSSLLQQTCGGERDSDMALFLESGCAGLFYCGPGAKCVMVDTCVVNFEHDGPAILYVTEETDYLFDNLYLDTAGFEDCELGVVRLNASMLTNCSNAFTLPKCPLFEA